ncbi:MAG TPA: XdhC/CoxI family protein [Spirochaetia bacterium]|nr:XdhC/CoxI family protein [Spirochaetia bacterium]
MREIINEVDRWIGSGEQRITVATVLKTYGSAPRGVGGKLAVAGDGRICGSISGGCVESAIIEEGLKMEPSSPPRVLHFETSNESAWEVGLPCGGTIDVLLENLEIEHYRFLKERVEANEWAFSVTILEGELRGRKISFDRKGNSFGLAGPLAGALGDGLRKLASKFESSTRATTDDGIELFVEAIRPAPTLVLVGGVHIAIALVAFAKTLGYRTIVVDPRQTFGSAERFPDVDRLIRRWPDEAFEQFEITPETSVVVLTHDPKLDDPALYRTLKSPAFYIGALGSNRTQENRKKRLMEMGFSEGELSRIHGPVGLDIDASTPEEIALSIITELVALSRHSKAVLRVSDFALTASRTERSIPS